MGVYFSELLMNGINLAKGGVDMGDHPPITPCRHAGDMARVNDLVGITLSRKSFVKTFMLTPLMSVCSAFLGRKSYYNQCPSRHSLNVYDCPSFDRNTQL